MTQGKRSGGRGAKKTMPMLNTPHATDEAGQVLPGTVVPPSGPTLLLPVPMSRPELPSQRPMDSARLYDDFMASFTPRTQRAYQKDLKDFAAFVGWKRGSELIGDFLASLTHQQANAVTMEYKNAMAGRGLSSATVNRRLASVKSIV